MLLTEYNEKETMKLFKKEAREDGLREGRELGRQDGLREGRELGRQDGLREGRKLGRQDEQKRLINIMLKNGNSPEKISEMTGLSLQQIQELQK